MVMEQINGEESGINNVDVDLGEDGSMTCTKHHPDNNPGGNGICALCLQEKLGNLVTSSLPIAPSFPPPSSSARAFGHSMSTNNRKPPRIPFLSNRNHGSDTTSFQRSKSTVTTSFRNGQRRSSSSSFWSFLYSSSSSCDGLKLNDNSSVVTTTSRASSVNHQSATTIVIAEDDEDEGENSPDPRSNTHMTNKVSRSRSVGCGGRSFSGDFFERLGDCTIRRVESQRQSSVAADVQQQQQQHKGIKERVRCTGFNLRSSFSSSEANSRTGSINASSSATTREAMHGRSRGWAWALASPLRAFAKPTSTSDNNNNNFNHNRVPPSLLSTENR